MASRAREFPAEREKPRVLNQRGEFDGSFSGAVRRRSVVDCLPWYRRREYYLEGWTDPNIWRAAVIECIASMMLVYLSSQWGATLFGYGQKQVGGYVGFFNAAMLAVFISATAPASGGHINPLITFSTMICGLCPVPRAVLYLSAQTLGAAVAGGLLRGSWGLAHAEKIFGGGCYFDPAAISSGQVLLTEFVCAWMVVFLAIGLGLDPRQEFMFGPLMGLVMVSLTVAIVTAATSGMIDGYMGAQIFPSRCLATAMARGSYTDHWVWWIGPALGSIANAVMYHFIPPWHPQKPGGGRPEEVEQRAPNGFVGP